MWFPPNSFKRYLICAHCWGYLPFPIRWVVGILRFQINLMNEFQRIRYGLKDKIEFSWVKPRFIPVSIPSPFFQWCSSFLSVCWEILISLNDSMMEWKMLLVVCLAEELDPPVTGKMSFCFLFPFFSISYFFRYEKRLKAIHWILRGHVDSKRLLRTYEKFVMNFSSTKKLLELNDWHT